MRALSFSASNASLMNTYTKDAAAVQPGYSNMEHGTSEQAQHKEVLGATHETLVIDGSLSRRVVRKYDYRLLPLFLLINLFSFIDRVNIGNARLLGMQKDLELGVGLRYNIALMCLFVSYCVVELPSNIACKKIGGHIWIPFLVFTFSVLTIFTSLVQNRGGLYAIRFLLAVVRAVYRLVWFGCCLRCKLSSAICDNTANAIELSSAGTRLPNKHLHFGC